MEDDFAGRPAAVGGRRCAVHRSNRRLGAVQAAHAERRALVHRVPRRRWPASPTYTRRWRSRRVRTFLEGLLHREAIPTLVEIPGHPREEYAASVLERFANVGVRDQIARVCIDGSAKFPTFLIPTIESAARARRPDRARGHGAGRLGALPRPSWIRRSRRSTPTATRRGDTQQRPPPTPWRSWHTRPSSLRRCAHLRASARPSPPAMSRSRRRARSRRCAPRRRCRACRGRARDGHRRKRRAPSAAARSPARDLHARPEPGIGRRRGPRPPLRR